MQSGPWTETVAGVKDAEVSASGAAPATLNLAKEALRWVAAQAVSVPDGCAWPIDASTGLCGDSLYDGTAGVLCAFAEASLAGLDPPSEAIAAANRCCRLAVTGPGLVAGAQPDDPGDASLYVGLGGIAVALGQWHQATGDETANVAAGAAIDRIAKAISVAEPLTYFQDLLLGQAGVLLTLVTMAGPEADPAIAILADHLVEVAERREVGLDWRMRPDLAPTAPNFSHGCAGIAYALARAGERLHRSDLVAAAAEGGHFLVSIGLQDDGGVIVPHSIPLRDPDVPYCWGWCHGPAGTVYLFDLLARLTLDDHWSVVAGGARRALRESGIPHRRYPGFWDNLGQCCGTAGVITCLLDHAQSTGDQSDLDWARRLSDDIMDRVLTDDDGAYWCHTEHRVEPSTLPPTAGWMQGTAGIAASLLRLERVQALGPQALRLTWPDHV